jgi:hypothetical protein
MFGYYVSNVVLFIPESTLIVIRFFENGLHPLRQCFGRANALDFSVRIKRVSQSCNRVNFHGLYVG